MVIIHHLEGTGVLIGGRDCKNDSSSLKQKQKLFVTRYNTNYNLIENDDS